MPISSDRRVRRTAFREREVLKISGNLCEIQGGNAVDRAIRHVLTWAQKRRPYNLPGPAWDGQDFDYMSGGRNCSAIRFNSDDTDIWAFRADEADKHVANRSWITEIIIAKKGDGEPHFAARLSVNSNEEVVDAVPATPGYVRQIANDGGIVCGQYRALDSVHFFDSEDQVDDLLDQILSPHRTIPLVVVAGTLDEKGNVVVPFNLETFATLMVGVAHVSVISPDHTSQMTDRLGRRLSVFNGGIRVYRVGFTDEDRLFMGNHLILGKNLQDLDDANAESERLRELLARDSLRRNMWDKRVISYSSVKSLTIDRRREEQDQIGATDDVKLATAMEKVHILQEQLREKSELLTEFEDENVRLEDDLGSARSQLSGARFRIDQLISQIQSRDAAPDDNIPIPDGWESFSDWCSEHLQGRVILSPSARRGVRTPLYNEPATTARALLWLANVYRDARINGGHDALRDAAVSEGVRNSPCGSDAYEIVWQGRTLPVDWHIKNGGNTRSPERCLRIYYSWDATTEQVIIADMPLHRTTSAS